MAARTFPVSGLRAATAVHVILSTAARHSPEVETSVRGPGGASAGAVPAGMAYVTRWRERTRTSISTRVRYAIIGSPHPSSGRNGWNRLSHLVIQLIAERGAAFVRKVNGVSSPQGSHRPTEFWCRLVFRRQSGPRMRGRISYYSSAVHQDRTSSCSQGVRANRDVATQLHLSPRRGKPRPQKRREAHAQR
jgi:hypothetical protein